MLNLDTRIPLMAQERDYGRGFDMMQQAQMNQLKLQALRDEYNAAKEERDRQRAMRQGMASELQKMQQGTPAQYRTTFPQTMPTGQMPQGMTGVLASERGQNLPQPALFGENILQGNFDINRELVSPAIAPKQPDIKDVLTAQFNAAVANNDAATAFDAKKKLLDLEKSPIKWGMNPQKGINPATGLPDTFVTNESGELRFLNVSPYEEPKTPKKSLIQTSLGYEVVEEGKLPKGKPVSTTQPRQSRLQQVTDASGTYILDMDTGETRPVLVNGKPVVAPKAAQTPSGEESNAAGFYLRMNEATKLINQFEGKGKPTVGTSAAGALPIIGDVLERNLMTPEQQQYKNAALAWIRAKLRKESGAAIGVDEAEQEYRNYFPVVGDSAEVVKQKQDLRNAAMREMKIASGKALPKAEQELQQPQPSKPTRTAEETFQLKKEYEFNRKKYKYDPEALKILDDKARELGLIK